MKGKVDKLCVAVEKFEGNQMEENETTVLNVMKSLQDHYIEIESNIRQSSREI